MENLFGALIVVIVGFNLKLSFDVSRALSKHITKCSHRIEIHEESHHK